MNTSSKSYIRLRGEGAEVVQVDLSTVVAWLIEFNDLDGSYRLIAIQGFSETTIKIGTFDACHSVLNKINSQLNHTVIDIV